MGLETENQRVLMTLEMVETPTKFNSEASETSTQLGMGERPRNCAASERKECLPDEKWTIGDAAKFYAEILGWRVFPVSPDTKGSLIQQWPRAATTDLAQIESWWRRWPSAMIGVVCGPSSGIAIVDADAKADHAGTTGLQHLEKVETANGNLGQLPTSYTPGGGIHLIFDAASLPFEKSEDRVAAKVDVRSSRPDGSGVGYAVLPPSANKGGVRYVWHNTSLDQLTAPPPAPVWLAHLAAFSDKDRAAIRRDAQLTMLLEQAPREEWQSLFAGYLRSQRRYGELEKLEEVADHSGQYSLSTPYIAKAIALECEEVANCNSAQNTQLNLSAFQLGTLLAGAGLAAVDDLDTDHVVLRNVESRLFDAAMQMRVLDPAEPWDSRAGQAKARKTIASALKAGLSSPRDLTQLNRPNKQQSPSASRQSGGALAVIRMADVQLEKLEWLWPGYVALGKISLIAGDPGVGKSQLTADLAARVTTGKGFRSSSVTGGGWTKQGAPGSVVLISCEDDPADTIRPRLEAAGADVERVHLVTGQKSQTADGRETISPLSLQTALDSLELLLSDLGDVRLVIIDPISAYMGSTDTHKNADVRAVLGPLAGLAIKHRVAVVVVSHLNKGSGENALYRVTGSLGFTGQARAVFLVSKDREDSEDDNKRLFLSVKNNLAKDNGGFEFHIKEVWLKGGIETSKIEWGRVVATSAAEALGASSTGGSKLSEAKDFLMRELSAGPVKQPTLKKEAKDEDLSWPTVRRAKAELRIEARREGFGDHGYWVWELPDESAKVLMPQAPEASNSPLLPTIP